MEDRTSISRMWLLFLWISLMARVVLGETDYCYAETRNPYQMFSCYTPYEYVREKSADPVHVPHCKPLQFWIMSRHGTRYTDDKGIAAMWSLTDMRDQIISNHDMESGELCIQDLENLRKWTPQAVSTVAMNLSPQGYKDLYNMAERFKTRFPTLLNHSYSPDMYEIRFTNTQRTTSTAFAFVKGIFGSTHNVRLPEPISADQLIRPSSYCRAWRTEVVDNKDILIEMTEFEKGPEIQAVIQNVSDRLGFDEELSLDDVNSMYSACRFEKAWNVEYPSPWCAVFSDEDLEVLLYREELKYYYVHGYGNEMNKLVGCPPAKDFLDRFSALENGETQPLGVFYFSHDTDLQLFFTSLGIGKDPQLLTHYNYQQMKNRQWQTSILTPFAGNFAAVFFQCSEGDPYQVQFYLREKLLNLDGCHDGMCDWSYIKQKYGSISKNCNLDFC